MKPDGEGQQNVGLIQAEPKIYARHVSGKFQNLRNIALWILLGLFYLLPWLQMDGHQALLFDLPARRFYIFGITLFPQDFVYLALLLIIAGLSLFFFTALAGRLWCGFACPQTVWTLMFMKVERLIEGDRNKRQKLDKSPWDANKIVRKSSKQFVWILIGLITGFTFVGFFTPIRELWGMITSFSLGPWETFWMIFYGFATYGNAGFMREQVCKYMCPYARFQGAMFDKDTLIISYDDKRGEPRGARRRKDDPVEKGLGSCIDCTLCVQVCPTGIDIRNGLQYECIACAACIDVCDQVMDRMGYERGLIKYTTEQAQTQKSTRLLRPRMIIYAVLLAALVTVWAYGLVNRTPMRAELIRDRNALYRELSDDIIENVYTLSVTNMDRRAHALSLQLTDLKGGEIDMDKAPSIAAESTAQFVLRIRAPRSTGSGGRTIHLKITAKDRQDLELLLNARFFLPASGP
ncbi:MAG: cytochrome c oxidase accessory protein CcoG [Xanthomonadales bacterium]|nr:cytochrome c oxidase accessory protein CcoG [Xanthomonadales bacterium]